MLTDVADITDIVEAAIKHEHVNAQAYFNSLAMEASSTIQHDTAKRALSDFLALVSSKLHILESTHDSSTACVQTTHLLTVAAAHLQGILDRVRSPGVSSAASSQRPPSRKRSTFPDSAIAVLEAWWESHSAHPFPSREEKRELAERAGISLTQATTWLINARTRRLGPRRSFPQAGAGPQ